MTQVRTKQPPPAPKLINRVAICLDSSGSMRHLSRAAVDAFNRNLRDLQAAARDKSQETYLTLVVFGDPDVKVPFTSVPVDRVEPMRYEDFRANALTPLYAAVGRAIQELRPTRNPAHSDASYLVIAITDGEENASTALGWPPGNLLRAIREETATDRWTFTFQVPRGYKQALVNALGLPAGNVMEWDQTDQGVETASASNSAGIQGYFLARSSGTRSVQNFYATTDASKIKAKDLKALVDVSAAVKIWDVPKEEVIQDFVARKSRRAYVIGAAFYQLMKSELVQPQKAVLIQDKASGKVYAGDDARELIGLPASSAGTRGRVKPGNHANFEIFVQSTSVNRKLPRGTKVAWLTTHTAPSQPTWVAPPTR